MTGASPLAAPNFGRTHPSHAERYATAGEYIDVVTGLWDCWADDALVADRATGRYLDATKIRALDHAGPHFSVKGPLNIGHAPKGRPVVLQAGGSAPGLDLAARTADVVFAVVQAFAEAQAQYATLKSRLPAHGRLPKEVAVLPGVMSVVGRTDAEAFEKLALLQGFVDSGNALALLSDRFGVDMAQYELDGPIPDLPVPETYHSVSRALLNRAQREGMTLRDVYNLTVAARGHWVLCGSAETVADTLEAWFRGGAVDGFNVMPRICRKGCGILSNSSCPLCRRVGCSGASMPAPPCATISAWHALRAD